MDDINPEEQETFIDPDLTIYWENIKHWEKLSQSDNDYCMLNQFHEGINVLGLVCTCSKCSITCSY